MEIFHWLYSYNDLINLRLFTRFPFMDQSVCPQPLLVVCLFKHAVMVMRKAHVGNMRWSSMSVFCFSSISSPVRCSTMLSRLSAYFSSFCSMLSIMSNFLQRGLNFKLKPKSRIARLFLRILTLRHTAKYERTLSSAKPARRLLVRPYGIVGVVWIW